MRAAALLALAACGTTASPELGLDQLLQVRDAQFRPGAFPSGDGAQATQVVTQHAAITIGTFREKLHGVLDDSAHAGAIGLADHDGAWIVPAGIPDIGTTGATIDAVIGLADDFPPGMFELVLAGADANGVYGPPASVTVVAEPEAPPAGTLVIGLEWSSTADLDLHVVDALGGEAWSDKPNTYVPPPPGDPPDPPEEPFKHGILDRDANAACRRDGRPAEHVIWTMPPPSGEYAVRVDARAMCGDPSAAWFATAYRCPTPDTCTLVGAARGVAVPDDVTYQTHGVGAGVLAFRFTL
jgi:hypothetical protein